MSEKKSLFFSYGHDNNSKLILDYLKPALEKEGFKIWVDKSEIKTGDDWRDSIVNGIENSSGVVAYLSKYSVRNPGVCRDELRIARSISGCRIVTVMLESPYEVQLPLTVSHIQYLDMSDWQMQLDKGEKIFNEWFDYKLNELKEAIEKNSDLPGLITEVRQKIKPALDSNSYVGDLENLLSGKIVSRDWIIKKVEDWQNSSDRKQVFCLKGEPGFGKSVVSAIIATECKLNAIGVHFCKLNSGFNDAKTIFTQLCFQLATKIPSYARALTSDEYNWDLANANDVFEKAFVDIPKRCIDGNREKSFLVIDALDEAPKELVEILAQGYKKLPKWLGFFVTSRPNESSIKQLLEEFSAEYIESSDKNNLDDVKTFINEQLLSFSLDNELKENFSNKLISAANGNFRYASVFLESLNKDNCSEIIFNFVKGKTVFPKSLNELYSSTFKQSFDDIDYYEKEILPILGLLTVSKYPVPFDFITSYLDISEKDLMKKLKRLNSMVRMSTNKDAVSLFHRSVQEWLLDKNNEYSVDKKNSENQLLQSLIDFLDFLLNHLEKDSSDESSSVEPENNEEQIDDIDDILGLSDEEENESKELNDENEGNKASILLQITYFICSFPDLLKNTAYALGKFDKNNFSKFIKEDRIQQLCSKLNELLEDSHIFDKSSEYYSNESQKCFLLFGKYINKLAIDLFGKEGIEDQQASHCLANVFLELEDFNNSEKLYSRVIKLDKKNHILDDEDNLCLYKNYSISLAENYKYKEACLQFEELLKNKKLPDNVELYFTVLLNYAGCLHELGQSTKALAIYDKCVELTNKNKTELDLDAKLTAINNKGSILQEQDSAEQRIEECEYVVEQAIKGGLNQPDIAFYKLNLANAYRMDEQFDKASSLIREAQAVYEKIYGNDSKEFLSIYESYCELYDSTGDIKSTLRTRRELVEKYKKYYGEESGQVITAKLNLIDTLDEMEAQSEILQIIDELNKSIEEKYGLDHPLSWEFLHKTAHYFVTIGNYDKAISIANKLNDSMKINGVDFRQLRYQDLLAATYCLSSHYEEALKIYQDCLSKKEQLLGKTSESYLFTLKGIANIYESLGDRKKAEKIHKTIVESYKANFGVDSLEYYESVKDYAHFLGDDDFVKGVDLFRDVLNKLKEKNGFYYEVLEDLADLLSISLSKKNIDESIEIYKEILKYKEKKFGPVSSSLIGTVTQLSDLLCTSNKNDEGLQLLLSKIKIFENKFSPLHKFVFDLKQPLIEIYLEMEKFASAINLCRELISSFSDFYGNFHEKTIEIKKRMYELEDLYVNDKGDSKSAEQMMSLYRETLSYYGEDNPITTEVGDSAASLNQEHKCNLDWVENYCIRRINNEEISLKKVNLMQTLAELFLIKHEFNKSHDLYKKAFTLYKSDCSELGELRVFEFDFEVKKVEFLLTPNDKNLKSAIKATLSTEILNEEPAIAIELLQELSQLLKNNNFVKESQKVDKKIKELNTATESDEDEDEDYFNEIQEYLENDDFKAALDVANRCFDNVKEIPDIEKDYYYLCMKMFSAKAYLGLEKETNAIEILESIIPTIKKELDFNDKDSCFLLFECYLLLGKIYYNQENDKKAFYYFNEWLEFEKTHKCPDKGDKIEVSLYQIENKININDTVDSEDIKTLNKLKKECKKMADKGDEYMLELLEHIEEVINEFS